MNSIQARQNEDLFNDRKTGHFKALTKSDHTSAIADHIKTNGHNIYWDQFDILTDDHFDTKRNYAQCNTVESKVIPQYCIVHSDSATFLASLVWRVIRVQLPSYCSSFSSLNLETSLFAYNYFLIAALAACLIVNEAYLGITS